MDAGRLRHRVTIQRPVRERQALGSFEEKFEDWFETWASVEPLGPREYVAAAMIASDITTRIRIRWAVARTGIDATMRVAVRKMSGSPTDVTYYKIEGNPIDILGRRREIHLMCRSRDAEGFRQGAP